MKKTLVLAFLVITVYACSDSGDRKASTTPAVTDKTNTAAMNNPDYDAGLKLVVKSGCFACHKLREQLIGPAYGAIAEKYENTPENVTMLAGKIIKGGSGVWGDVLMIAHPDISQADAETMVKYIMLLKN